MLTDAEVRHLAIELLTAPTARDRQRRIGASNLSNQCDRCLAANFLGDPRETPFTAKTWMGRVLGTAFHAVLEQRIAEHKQSIMQRFPNAVPERHVFFAEIVGYGPVGGTIDLDLGPEESHLIDWKGSTRKKLCILVDYIRSTQGLDPVYGRTHKAVKLSENEYEAEMKKMAYKVQGYYGQQDLYMHGSGRRRASLVLLNRDGTGYFDVPTDARYDDPKAVHDVWVLSFDYDPAYAEALIARGQAIWTTLENGAKPEDFTSHEMCFVCGLDDSNYEQTAPDLNLSVGVAA